MLSFYYLLGIKTRLIGAKAFAFRGERREPPRRIAPVGSHASLYSRRSLRLSLQSTAEFVSNANLNDNQRDRGTGTVSTNSGHGTCPSCHALI